MRVLFYLPNVTPWWFEHIVEPIMRRVATVAEVHVLAPPPWRNTGVGAEQLGRCADLRGVAWHIVDDDEHPSLRTEAADREAVVAFVRALAPDLVFCRTADVDTARAFPGTVRFLMEVANAPLDVGGHMTSIVEQPFHNGAVPALDAAADRLLDTLLDPLWIEMEEHQRNVIPARDALFGALGIADDRPMLVMPLEYEHEENFFLHHRQPAISTRNLVTRTAKKVAPGCTLVVTDHPLNIRYVDRGELHHAISNLGRNVVLAPARLLDAPATLALLRHADGLILGDSKSFGMGALFGVPMLRRSRFASAAWLNTEDDLGRFTSAVRAGRARAPAVADARRWFAFHLANEAFYPKDEALTGEALIDRAMRPVDPGRWQAGIARVRAARQERAL